MNKDKNKQGKTLQQLIAKQGYTIRQFCKEAEISQAGFYKYISGEREPSLIKALSMCRTLKISVKVLATYLGKDVMGVPNDE